MAISGLRIYSSRNSSSKMWIHFMTSVVASVLSFFSCKHLLSVMEWFHCMIVEISIPDLNILKKFGFTLDMNNFDSKPDSLSNCWLSSWYERLFFHSKINFLPVKNTVFATPFCMPPTGRLPLLIQPQVLFEIPCFQIRSLLYILLHSLWCVIA